MVVVDLLSIFIASIVFIIIRLIWFAPFIFGTIWKKAKNIDLSFGKKYWWQYPFYFVVALVMAYFIALIEGYLGVTSFWDGVIAGFVIWLGFVFTIQLINAFSTKIRWKIFFLENGYWLFNFLVMGGVIAG